MSKLCAECAILRQMHGSSTFGVAKGKRFGVVLVRKWQVVGGSETHRLTAQHLNCALAPGLQFDTLELRNPPAVACLESLHVHVQVVRSIVVFEDGYNQLHFWRGWEVDLGLGLIFGQKQRFCEALEI